METEAYVASKNPLEDHEAGSALRCRGWLLSVSDLLARRKLVLTSPEGAAETLCQEEGGLWLDMRTRAC